MRIDISKVIQTGNVLERFFFSFLVENEILWIQGGSNLDFIDLINEDDFETVKAQFDIFEAQLLSTRNLIFNTIIPQCKLNGSNLM